MKYFVAYKNVLFSFTIDSREFIQKNTSCGRVSIRDKSIVFRINVPIKFRKFSTDAPSFLEHV